MPLSRTTPATGANGGSGKDGANGKDGQDATLSGLFASSIGCNGQLESTTIRFSYSAGIDDFDHIDRERHLASASASTTEEQRDALANKQVARERRRRLRPVARKTVAE